MKQTVWIGSLLVVPLAALFWLGSGDERSEKVSRPSVDSADAVTFSEGGELAKDETPRAAHLRSDARDAPRHDVVEVETPPELPADDSDDESDPVERARRIRLPVILAIRGKHATPEARSEAMLEALRKSGSSNETWTRQSASVFDEWTQELSNDIGHQLNWTSAECYQAGCEVELSFPDRASYERAASEFRSIRDDDATHGGRVQTPAVEGNDGKLRASWIMLRPDGSQS